MLATAYPRMEIDGPVTNLVDMKQILLNSTDYDVIYCDIQLEDDTCFSVLEDIDITTPIIFTTAYNEFALKAFEVNGIDYLLKPIAPKKLHAATRKALTFGRGRQDIAAMLDSLGLKTKHKYLHYIKGYTFDGSYIINTTDVNHFIINEKKAYAMMNDGTRQLIEYTLDQLMQRLDPIMFFRANHQYIVNRNSIHRIQTWGNRQVLLKLTGFENEQIIVNKEKIKALNDWIEQ